METTQHDITLNNLVIICNIARDGTNDCTGSNGNFTSKNATRGSAIPPLSRYPTLIDQGNAHNFLTATWPNSNSINLSNQGLSLYLGQGKRIIRDLKVRTDKFNFSLSSNDIPAKFVTLNGSSQGTPIQLSINPSGSAIYMQAHEGKSGACRWNSKLNVNLTPALPRFGDDTYIFFTDPKHPKKTVRVSGHIVSKLGALIDQNTCHLLVYTDAEYFSVKIVSKSELKNYPAGTYVYPGSVSFEEKTTIQNATYEKVSGTKNTYPYHVTINGIKLIIASNHYLDTPSVQLTNGASSVSEIIYYHRSARQFDSPAINVDIHPGQNSHGIDYAFDLTWSTVGGDITPSFTDSKSTTFPVNAYFYPQPNGSGTPVKLSPMKSATPETLEGCPGLNASGFCPEPYKIEFSIPTQGHTPSTGIYHVQGQLTIWGNFHPDE